MTTIEAPPRPIQPLGDVAVNYVDDGGCPEEGSGSPPVPRRVGRNGLKP